MPETLFRFKEFEVSQEQCAMKINTDGVLLGAWVDVAKKSKVLDIGTGSGVIAMMLAQRCASAKVVGVEVDESSCTEASANMAACPWCDSLVAVQESIQDYARTTRDQFDLIVSNPPFFTGGTLSSTQMKTDVRHTTKLPHTDLLRAAFSLLTPDGDFSVILPHIEGLRFIELAEQSRLYANRITEVTSLPEKPIERLLINFTKIASECKTDRLAIRKSPEQFSDDYVELTRPFYLKF